MCSHHKNNNDMRLTQITMYICMYIHISKYAICSKHVVLCVSITKDNNYSFLHVPSITQK